MIDRADKKTTVETPSKEPSREQRDMHHSFESNPYRGHFQPPVSRRDFLARAGCGFGALALQSLLLEDGLTASSGHAGETPSADPHAPRASHFRGGAKSVIFLFMDGGPSHIDTFDPKPMVNKHAGEPMPQSIERVITPMGVSENPILASKRKWKRYGESGLPISDWYPHIGECADDLCVIRSCWANGLNHVGSVCQMNTGSILAGRPSLGAWVTYGLGSENHNLPGFVILLDNAKEPPGGSRVWGTGFMPATFQGTRFRNGAEPILHLKNPDGISDARQQGKLEFINRLNRRHLETRPAETELEARIASYELAFRMQSHAPEAVDVSQETRQTQHLYGLDHKTTAAFGRNCLLARRLVERGLLDETLVVWGGEFGRTPMSEKGTGRDHNPYGFTMWLAGGGTRGGQVIGATDDFGMHAVADHAHVHDLHATILHAAGLDHEALIYRHQGRPERATVNEGMVIEQAFV